MSALLLGATVNADVSDTVAPYEQQLELTAASKLNSEQIAALQKKTRISCPNIVVKLYKAWAEEQYDTFSPDDGVRIFIENYRGAYGSSADFIHDEKFPEVLFLDVKNQCDRLASKGEAEGVYQFIDDSEHYGEVVHVFSGPAVYADLSR